MKVLVLAETGFGKTIAASGCKEPEYGIDIQGLNPEETYFISVTSKPLPFRGSNKIYPPAMGVERGEKIKNLTTGRRLITNDAYLVAEAIIFISSSAKIKNIVIDDTNYLMQDYMMKESLKTGWDAPKKVGHFMSKIFDAMEIAEVAGKNIFMLAHYDEKKKNNDGELTFKMKTTGQSTSDMINPEGKFDVTLFGLIKKLPKAGTVERYFLTQHDGTYPAKSAPGIFPKHIPNDLGFVEACISAYYNGDPMPISTVSQEEGGEANTTATPTA